MCLVYFVFWQKTKSMSFFITPSMNLFGTTNIQYLSNISHRYSQLKKGSAQTELGYTKVSLLLKYVYSDSAFTYSGCIALSKNMFILS